MVRIFLAALLASLTAVSASAVNWFVKGTVWHCISKSAMAQGETSGAWYRLADEVDHDGETWLALESFWPSKPDPTSVYGYVRADGDKVYALRDGEAVLAYDFGMLPGESSTFADLYSLDSEISETGTCLSRRPCDDYEGFEGLLMQWGTDKPVPEWPDGMFWIDGIGSNYGPAFNGKFGLCGASLSPLAEVANNGEIVLRSKSMSSIELIESVSACHDGDRVWYDLQGRRVAAPKPGCGVLIRVTTSGSSKVRF